MKKIAKKIMIVFLCLILSATLFACAKSDSPNGQGEAPGDPHSAAKLTDLMEDICKDAKVPAYDVFELDKSNFEAYGFAPWTEGIEAVCSEGKITTSAHSLVLIRTNHADAETIAKTIAEKADVRKWVCVEAETGKVLYTDSYVLMIMTYRDAFDGLKANFEKLAGSEEVKSLDIKSSKQAD